MIRKEDRLRNGFNDWAESKGSPAYMAGVTSMFPILLKDTPINQPGDLIGHLSEPMATGRSPRYS
jgi:glutamate-1-semialdehyde aminotransferase